MAELVPYPFGRLISRMFRELEQRGSIFDLPERKFVLGEADRKLSVSFHGRVASTPLGPAAGPQSQLAQNLVLCFLGGARILELKTVQLDDELKIPRPCIDMQTVGYNVEWSQELKLEQSLEEYVKASMLIEILLASGKLKLAPGFDRVIFDMSVGYDLKGVQSERMRAFVRGMRDARDVVERLREQIPTEYRRYRDLPFRTRISDAVTLSTFHGCPPGEIEGIASWLMEKDGLDCVVKLNPTLLGKRELGQLFNEVLGYQERVPDSAFEKDTRWEQAVEIVDRLGAKAAALGRGFGVKLTNTLIVENQRDFFPKTEKVMYLSGPPLHVLAMSLVAKVRGYFGDRFPISFSAGVDRGNFADAVALGLTPVTVCSDLLRPGGYGRMHAYFQELYRRMDAVGAKSIDDFILKAYGQGGTDPRRAALLNTQVYLERLMKDPRYARAANSKPPKKIGSKLELFDCITCDKCVPVCPNDANFTYVLPPAEIPIATVAKTAEGWRKRRSGTLRFQEKHQLANFADFCNECGNCDVFCPEDGGPYALKPRFFGSEVQFRQWAKRDGFYLERSGGRETVLGRFQGREYRLVFGGGLAIYSGDGFELRFPEANPEGGLEGHAEGEVDLTYFHIMSWMRKAVLESLEVNYVNA